MISKINLENFGPISKLTLPQAGKINLILGENGTGKTFLLKALYAAMRTLELHRRGKEHRTAAELLSEKLYWTFQCDRIGELVKRGEKTLTFEMELDSKRFYYQFGKDTTRQIAALECYAEPRPENSIFLPAKEVVSIHEIILKSREDDQAFGFDDTYLDLARALRQQPRQGRNYRAFATSRKRLKSLIGGNLQFDKGSNVWNFKVGNQKFPIGVTAEGVKKISILDILLSNRYLSSNSVIFIDEPESALHPQAISKLLDIVHILSTLGLQFFMASHSYFVIKKLHLLAIQHKMDIPVLMRKNDQWVGENLQNGMPQNKIIDESIELYEQETLQLSQ